MRESLGPFGVVTNTDKKILITLANILLLWRWRSFSKDNDDELSEKEDTGEHGDIHL
jgi:hypothetical protein